MAYLFDCNNVGGANGGAEVIFDLKALLVSAGWDVPRSGDGTNAADSDLLDTVTKMAVSLAWFRIRAPAGMSPRREFCIQRGSTGTNCWWIKVSAEDTFTLTPGSGASMATASDQQNLWGTTTAGTALFGTAATYKYHMAADNASPYAWYAMALVNTTGATSGVIMFEPLLVGSYPSGDQDPALYYATAGGLGYSVIGVYTSTQYGWYAKDLAGELWVVYPALLYYSYAAAALLVIPLVLSANPYDNDDNLFPIPYARSTGYTQPGWKGFGHMMKWVGKNRTTTSTLSVATSRDKIIIDSVALPWDGSVPVL